MMKEITPEVKEKPVRQRNKFSATFYTSNFFNSADLRLTDLGRNTVTPRHHDIRTKPLHY